MTMWWQQNTYFDAFNPQSLSWEGINSHTSARFMLPISFLFTLPVWKSTRTQKL